MCTLGCIMLLFMWGKIKMYYVFTCCCKKKPMNNKLRNVIHMVIYRGWVEPR